MGLLHRLGYSVVEYLLLKRTWVQFPALTWWLITIQNSSSRGILCPSQTSGGHGNAQHTQAKHPCTQRIFKKYLTRSTPVTQVLRRLLQEDHEFRARINHIARLIQIQTQNLKANFLIVRFCISDRHLA